MKRIATFVLVTIALFMVSFGRQARADDPAYIALSYQGWNYSATGEEYWTTPTNINSVAFGDRFVWSVEVWKASNTRGSSFPPAYQVYLSTTLHSDGQLLWLFEDKREGPLESASDKVLLLFNSYSAQLGYSPSAPRPQAYFEVSDYGYGWGWYDQLGIVPDGQTWAVFVATHNKFRPDEVSLTLIDYGSGTNPSDLPNGLAAYVGWVY